MSEKVVSTMEPREIWGRYFKNNSGLVVDLGCGYGADSYTLAQLGYKVMAVDETNNLRFEHPNLTFVQQDIAVPIVGEFDGVIANFSLHFLPPAPRLQTVRYYVDHLKPGGIFYILIFKQYVTPLFLKQFPQAPAIEYYVEEDDHPPEGKHIHEIAKIVYREPMPG